MNAPVCVPLDGIAEFVTLEAASRRTGLTYAGTRKLLLRARVPFYKVGDSYLVKLRDVRAALAAK